MNTQTELQPVQINVGHNQQAFTPELQQFGEVGLLLLSALVLVALLTNAVSGFFSKSNTVDKD